MAVQKVLLCQEGIGRQVIKGTSHHLEAFVITHALMQQHIAVLGIMKGRLHELLLQATLTCQTIKTNYFED